MIYIQPLKEYKFNLKSRKLEGLARLSRLGIPTVTNLFIVLPSLFLEYQKIGVLPSGVISEFEMVFNSIKKLGDSVALRNSIFEEGNPGLSYSLHNFLNIKSFDDFLKKLILGFKKVKNAAVDSLNVEFCYLIQSFYSSEKCGVLLSENGQKQIFIQAILGQHTDLLLRGDITPDEYLVDKRTYRISSQQIANKDFRIKKLRTGIKKVRVKKEEQGKSVLDSEQIVRLAKLSQIVEKDFGPQEMEWAVLDDGKVIFQEARNLSQVKSIKFLEHAEVIFSSETDGEIIHLHSLGGQKDIANKIVVTSNLNISFINKLAFLYRPKAVILTKGSITSHAATILRESKITTLLIKNVPFKDGDKIKIAKDGSILKVV